MAMINLLSPQYKKQLQEEQRFRFVAIFGFSIFVFLICFVLMLVALRLYVSNQIQTEKFFTTIPPKELALQNQTVQSLKQANADFSALSKLYEKRFSPTTILEHTINDLPSDISLQDIEVSSAGVSLKGFAPTRNSLLNFRKALEADSLFKSVLFPLTNLATEQNIAFTIQMQFQTIK